MQTISLTLTAEQWNVVLAGMSELPIKLAIDTMNALIAQVKEQTAPKLVEKEAA